MLMSIKPEFADLIFTGEKGYEYRKVLFKNPAATTVIVYASSPVQKVIGEFEVEALISLSPAKLWTLTKNRSGISKQYFTSYFGSRKLGHAIKIGKHVRYKTPKDLTKDFKKIPPQSFCYLQ